VDELSNRSKASRISVRFEYPKAFPTNQVIRALSHARIRGFGLPLTGG